MGLIRRPGTAAVAGEEPPVMYTGCFVQSRRSVEEPSSTSEGRVRVLNEPVRGTSVVEETEGREGRNS